MNLFTEIGIRFDIPLYREDNLSAIRWIEQKKSTMRTRHLNLKLYAMRNSFAKKLMNVVYCNTNENIADLFTKPLPKKQFQYLRDKLRMRN